MTIVDVGWVYDNDGGAGEDKYCIGGTPTPTLTPTSTPIISEAGKDWLATYAGVDNCFAASGVSFKDLEGETHDGGTSAVCAMLYVAQEVDEKDAPIVNSKTYDDFYAANGNNKISLDDVGWVADHESGADQYCIGVTLTPTPTPTPTSTLTPTPTLSPGLSPTPTPTQTPSPSPISSHSPTPTLIDSDGDGVPDRYDYAPYDPNIQINEDIKPEATPETTPTPQPPGFEVLFVIVGLLLVAYLIKRREVK